MWGMNHNRVKGIFFSIFSLLEGKESYCYIVVEILRFTFCLSFFRKN